MPFISSTTSMTLTQAQKETVKTRLGQVVEKVTGKSENWLMISFQEGNDLFFQGKKGEKVAFLEVKLVGTLSAIEKTQLIQEIGDVFQTELGIPSKSIYIVITEISGTNWGWNNNTFA